MFTNRKILLVCKEGYSYPLYFLAEKLIKNNSIASYFFNPSECSFNPCDLNIDTYYRHKSLGVKIYDTKLITELFTENIKKPKINYLELQEYESTYSYYKNFNLQLLSTQKFTTYYHDRFYYNDANHEQKLYWLYLNYKNTEKILNEFKPDVILDIDNSELARTVLLEVSNRQNIPYINIEHPRYKLYKVPTFNLSLKQNVLLSLNQYDKNDIENLKEQVQYVNEFRSMNEIMSSEYTDDITSDYDRRPIADSIKNILEITIYFIKQDIISLNFFKKSKNKILFAPSLRFISFYILIEVRRWYLLGKNRYFEEPLSGQDYVYMPLHLIPESSTLTVAPYYIDEISIIEQVSKSLPIGWFLYIKEHQAMVGQRSFKFYKRIQKLHNVKLVQLNYYKDPKPWITKSKGVITITGTSAFEAVMLGKRALVLGNVCFEQIDGVIKVESLDKLPIYIKEFNKPLDNIMSCAKYIKKVADTGIEVNLKKLISDGEIILKRGAIRDKEYDINLDRLAELFYSAYEFTKELES